MDKISQNIRDIQHFGEEGGVVPVIDVATTSTFLNPEDMVKTFHGEKPGCYLYSRHSNPSVNMFGSKIAGIEGLKAAQGVASGMSAIASTVTQILKSGDHIVASRTVYGGTYAYFANLLPKMGINVSFVDCTNLKEVKGAIQKNTKIIYSETLSNPLLEVCNIPALKEIATKHQAQLIIDNTFTPCIVSAGSLGADVVIHSCTKYISGASDLIAGVIISSQQFIDQLIDINHGVVMLTGPTMDPRVAHELYLRLDHLPIRMKAHSHSAKRLAERMQELGCHVIYPGLSNHPQHQLFSKIKNSDYGYGGMLTLDCGNAQKALKLSQLLQDEKFGLYAVSLGFSRTLMSCPAVSTSSEIPEHEQNKMKLSKGLLRLSIGFTGDDDIMWERFKKCYKQL